MALPLQLGKLARNAKEGAGENWLDENSWNLVETNDSMILRLCKSFMPFRNTKMVLASQRFQMDRNLGKLPWKNG